MTDWRGIFVTLGMISALLLVATLVLLEETWQPRAAGSPDGFGVLLGDRVFRGFLAMAGCLGIVLFSYISMSSFVFREDFGIGPVGFSWIFGANAVGMVVGGQVNARLVGRHGPARMLRAGLVLLAGSACCLVVALALAAPLGVVLAPLWCVLAGLGLSFGNAPRSPSRRTGGWPAGLRPAGHQPVPARRHGPPAARRSAARPASPWGSAMALAAALPSSQRPRRGPGLRRSTLSGRPGRSARAPTTGDESSAGPPLEATLPSAGERGYVGTTLAQIPGRPGSPPARSTGTSAARTS